MIGALRKSWNYIRGGGEYSVTVPPMDGALNPNTILEDAAIFAEAKSPDNVCRVGEAILFSSDGTIYRKAIGKGNAKVARLEEFDTDVTAMASLGDAVAIALASGSIVIKGGSHDGRTIEKARESTLGCVTALAFAEPSVLLVCNGSARLPAREWKRDLMQLGRTGSVWKVNLATSEVSLIADRLGWPNGIIAGPGAMVTVSESWRHRLVSFGGSSGRENPVLNDLPAYPGRLAAAVAGNGYWLSLFAPRRQLTEFVLREPGFRRRMITEIDPEYWVGPTLAPMRSFLEPLQGGTLKKLAAIKPWAPSRSYGLVARLDEDAQPVASLHSRADGQRHGITSTVEADGTLYGTSHGSAAVIAVRLDEIEV